MKKGGVHASREKGYTEAEVQALLRPAKLFNAMKPMMLDFFFPVGTIIESTDSTYPGDKFGGTWEQIKDRFTLAAGDTYTAGDTGGEAKHTLTGAESGQKALSISGGGHSHVVNVKYRTGTLATGTANRIEVHTSGTNTSTGVAATESNSGSHSHSVSASDAASAHNNMPPYVVVYKWKRTA